ncbi:uncharacterized protein V6R79_019956 [Siganus canaliculatus]
MRLKSKRLIAQQLQEQTSSEREPSQTVTRGQGELSKIPKSSELMSSQRVSLLTEECIVKALSIRLSIPQTAGLNLLHGDTNFGSFPLYWKTPKDLDLFGPSDLDCFNLIEHLRQLSYSAQLYFPHEPILHSLTKAYFVVVNLNVFPLSIHYAIKAKLESDGNKVNCSPERVLPLGQTNIMESAIKSCTEKIFKLFRTICSDYFTMNFSAVTGHQMDLNVSLRKTGWVQGVKAVRVCQAKVVTCCCGPEKRLSPFALWTYALLLLVRRSRNAKQAVRYYELFIRHSTFTAIPSTM